MGTALEILLVILGIIVGLITLYGFSIGATFIYWIYKFLKDGDG